jgi:hypothetical protein
VLYISADLALRLSIGQLPSVSRTSSIGLVPVRRLGASPAEDLRAVADELVLSCPPPVTVPGCRKRVRCGEGGQAVSGVPVSC